MQNDTPSHVGTGIAFPLRVDHTGSLALVGGDATIVSSIKMILGTAPGERVMRPLFGCRIWDLMFEPINVSTLSLMREAVREALGRWEPRIDLADVKVEPNDAAQGRVDIAITYTIRPANDARNLVFPFYVIPGEDGGEHPGART